MRNITEQPDPATNSRFEDLGNGQYSELISTQTQLFYDPVTMDCRLIFNGQPYVSLGSYRPLGPQLDQLFIEVGDRMTERFYDGVNPLTGNDLSNLQLLDLMVYAKILYDTLHNERAAKIAADNAAAEAAAAAAAAAAAVAPAPSP